MVSFRKLFTVLAVGLLLTGVASAQSNCTATASNPVVRAEGLTEQIGSVLITCTSVPTSGTVQGYFTLKTDNPNITNTINTSPDPDVATNVKLFVNTGSDFVEQTGIAAKLTAANQLSFDNVSLPFATGSTQLTVRIDNVRVNASQGGGAGSTIKMFVTGYGVVQGSQTIATFVTNAQVTVAQIQQGLTFGVTAQNGAFQQCNATDGTTTAPSGTSANANYAIIKFTPGFPLAFKTAVGENAALGTRLTAKFTVPANADVYVGGANLNTDGYTIRLVSPTPAGTWTKVTASDGVYQAVWEVTDFAPGNLTQAVLIPVTLKFAATKPAVSQVGVTGSFYPTSSVGAASADAAVPRFVDGTTGTPTPILSVVACSTTLLFPWVTNSDKWVTGIVITNTTQDVQTAGGTYLFSGGTTASSSQAGTCTLNYFPAALASGATAPAAQTTDSVAAGRSAVVVLDSATAADAYKNFQGYVIANCNFQRAHGFAFMTSGQNQGGVGYNALVLATPRGTALPESLGQ